MNDRAVSTAVGHVLAIGITTLLISGLLMAGGDFLASEQELSMEESLRVEGAELAAEITVVDTTVQETGTEGTVQNVTVVVGHPKQIVGSSYTIELSPSGDCIGATNTSISCLELSSSTGRATIRKTVPFRNTTNVQQSSASGGPIEIRANNSSIWITEAER